METTKIEDTSPIKIGKQKKPKGPRRWPWIVLGILLMFVITAVGGYLGYQQALTDRAAEAEKQKKVLAATQFQLGIADQEAGRLELARQRYEYVIKLDPVFPGASQKLTEVMVAMSTVKIDTPTPVPTPTVQPTQDLRGEEELFNQAVALLNAGEWQTTIEVLDALRQRNLQYRAVEADGIYYTALRNRGVDKITKKGNLEGGLYDLALAERFAPLDKEAQGYRTWARLYITGAVYWGLDWQKVIEYFAQIYPTFPNMRDGSGWTAADRYRIANVRYADTLLAQEKWCEADGYYQNALAVGGDEASIAPTATKVRKLCAPVTKTPKPEQIEPTVDTGGVVEPTSESGGGTVIEPTVEPTVDSGVEEPTAAP